MSKDLCFPADEPKETVTWQRGYDFMDGSPRYTFEGRDPQNTLERFQVVIYAEREREYQHDPASARRFYYGYVRDNKLEYADTVGRFRLLKEAKAETLKLFNRYMELFASKPGGEGESVEKSQDHIYEGGIFNGTEDP